MLSLILAAFGRSPNEARPLFHQNPALLEEVGATIGGLHPIGVDVRQGELADLARRVGTLRRPIPKRRTEPVRHGIDVKLRRSFESVLALIAPPRGDGKTRPELSANSGIISNSHIFRLTMRPSILIL